MNDFPEMTEEDLKIFFTRTYQLQQAISYHAEMLGDNAVLQLDSLKGGVGSLSNFFSTIFNAYSIHSYSYSFISKHIFNTFFSSHR